MDIQTSTQPQHFPRRHRLRKRREFQLVFRRGRSVSCQEFRVVLCPNGLDHPRLGLAVGRRVGGAVVRNRVKRFIREIFRRERHFMPASTDLVVIPRTEASALSYHPFREAFLGVMARGRKVAEDMARDERSSAT